jgi:hypothetical protein
VQVIVLSAGMPKAGTGWHFNLTNDLLIAAGCQDVREIRQRFRLYSTLRFHNCNVERLTVVRLALITIPHLLGNTFVVKTHSGPTNGLRVLMSARATKVTYIYRDPRDVAVSAFEAGQRIRDRGESHSFATLDSIKAAILRVSSRYLAAWDAWMALSHARPNQILLVRYEDLVADISAELERLTRFLKLDVTAEHWSRIAVTYQRPEIRADEEVLHFNRGVVGRFRSTMNSEELELCQLHFGAYLNKMGYGE